MRWNRKHLLDTHVMDREDLDYILDAAESMEPYSGIFERVKQPLKICDGMVLATAFFEPSTRTKKSFQAAMLRLGGTYIDMDDEAKSSMAKGESSMDTLRMLSNYSDILAVRHRQLRSVPAFASALNKPVINGGDGANSHPTQAIADLYTMKREKGAIDGLHIAMVGDLRYGRTAHSLADALGNYSDVHVVGICPPGLSMPREFISGISYEEKQIKMMHLDDVLAGTCPDVVYATRVLVERLGQDANAFSYLYTITPETMQRLPEHTILMHPLPRPEKGIYTARGIAKPATWDIDTAVDGDPRAVYHKQAAYGVPTRMAEIVVMLGMQDKLGY